MQLLNLLHSLIIQNLFSNLISLVGITNILVESGVLISLIAFRTNFILDASSSIPNNHISAH
jgi:hypothetical protein